MGTKTKKLETKTNGIERYQSANGKIFYRARYDFNRKTHRGKKCSTSKEAQIDRIRLITEVESGACKPKESKKIKKIIKGNKLTVTNILENYLHVLEVILAGRAFSDATLRDKIYRLKNMVKYEEMNPIGKMFVSNLQNVDLLKVKNEYFLLRNSYGERYSVNTIRKHLMLYEESFKDYASHSDEVANVVANLKWDNLLVSKKEQNSPTMLAILDNEKKLMKPGDIIRIGDTNVYWSDDSHYIKHKTKTRVNDTKSWDTKTYRKFAKYFESELEKTDEELKMKLKGSNYQYFVFFSIAYHTGLRYGEIKALRWNCLYNKKEIWLLTVDHAIPQHSRHIERDSDDYWERCCKTKNRESRLVNVPNELYSILERYKRITAPIDDEYFIFYNCKPSKGFLNHLSIQSNTSFDRKHVQLMQKAEVPVMRIHDFRKSFAYHNRFEKENDDEYTKLLLGHTDDGSLLKEVYAPGNLKTSEEKIVKHEKKKINKRKKE